MEETRNSLETYNNEMKLIRTYDQTIISKWYILHLQLSLFLEILSIGILQNDNKLKHFWNDSVSIQPVLYSPKLGKGYGTGPP